MSRSGHRVPGLGPRRVDHANQAREHQVLFDAVVRAPAVSGERIPGQPSGGDPEGPQCLAGQPVVGLQDLCPALGRQRAPLGAHELAAAAAQQDVGRAFGEDDQAVLLFGIAMQGAHELALGGKRHLAHARQAGLERLRLHARFPRRHEQRPFGRVAVDDPPAVVGHDGGVVGAIRDAQGAFQLDLERSVDRSAAVASHFTVGRVPRP